jgi:cholesterol transport system auxiliary component
MNRIVPKRRPLSAWCTRTGALLRSLRRGMALPAVALVAAACSVLPPPAPDPALHVLAPPSVPVAAQTRRDLVLEVSAPRAAPGFDSAAMLYVQKPYALDAFATHRWADAPARMVGPLLVRALEQSGAFRAVVPGPSAIVADLRLDTELVRLQQNFLTRPSRVELTLRLQLFDLRSRSVVATKLVDAASEAPTDDPDGGVIAANAALAQALEQAVAFCAGAAADVRPRPAN